MNEPMLMSISRADGHHVALVSAKPADAHGQNQEPQLEFERVGKLIYLAQVTLGPGETRELPVPAAPAH
jgi:hypothetical protein